MISPQPPNNMANPSMYQRKTTPNIPSFNGQTNNYYSRANPSQNSNTRIEPNKAQKVRNNPNKFVSEIKKNKGKEDILDDLFGTDKKIDQHNTHQQHDLKPMNIMPTPSINQQPPGYFF